MGLLLGDIHVSIPGIENCRTRLQLSYTCFPHLPALCLLMAYMTHIKMRVIASAGRMEKQLPAYQWQCHRSGQIDGR